MHATTEAPRKCARRQATATAAFTLLELLIVLGLISVLLGISVGLFKKASPTRALAISQVKDAVRAARLFAIEQSANATVDFDLVNNRILASGFVSVGNWHFEDEGSIGWPTDAVLNGSVEIIEDGAIGRALRLSQEGVGYASLGRSPSFDPDGGVLVDCFLRVRDSMDSSVISKGRAYALHVTGDDGLTFTVLTRELGGAGQGEGELRSLALTRCVALGEWMHIQAAYDGRRSYVIVNGRELGSREFESRMPMWPDVDASLVVGSTESRFTGDVDEVRVSSAVVNDAPQLPDGVHFDSPTPIYFDPSGRLDPLRHGGPAVITLVYDEEQRRREVCVGLYGEIR